MNTEFHNKEIKFRKNISELILGKIASLVIVANKKGEIVYANPTVKTMLGYEIEEILNEGWWNLIHKNAEKRQVEKDYGSKCFEDPKNINTRAHVSSVIAKDGGKKWIQWKDTLSPDGYLIGIGQDVTDQIQQKEIIKIQNKQLELLSSVASKTQNVVLILNEKGDIIWVSKSFEKLNNTTYEEFIKKNGKSIFDASNNADIKTIFDKCIHTKKSVRYESLNSRIKDREVWELSIITPIFGHRGNLKYVIIVDSDSSDRNKLKKELKNKNKDLLDGLKYARHIQSFLISDLSEIKNDFCDCYVINIPKHIVSGDFHWHKKVDHSYFFFVGDCTGHGVPASMLSMVGITLLNKIIKPSSVDELNKVQHKFYGFFDTIVNAKFSSSNTINDNINSSFFKIDTDTNELVFFGINRPLFIVSENTLIELKSFRLPVFDTNNDIFNNNPLKHKLKKGDWIYAFSDGFYDQFGGINNQKFSIKRLEKNLLEISSYEASIQQSKFNELCLKGRGPKEQTDDILIFALQY